MAEIICWHAVSCAATQELPNSVWTAKVHCHVHMSPPCVPNLSHINPVQYIILTSINYPLMSWSSWWSLLLWLSRQHPISILLLPIRAIYVLHILFSWRENSTSSFPPLTSLDIILTVYLKMKTDNFVTCNIQYQEISDGIEIYRAPGRWWIDTEFRPGNLIGRYLLEERGVWWY
jgi:hypothetical protein